MPAKQRIGSDGHKGPTPKNLTAAQRSLYERVKDVNTDWGEEQTLKFCVDNNWDGSEINYLVDRLLEEPQAEDWKEIPVRKSKKPEQVPERGDRAERRIEARRESRREEASTKEEKPVVTRPRPGFKPDTSSPRVEDTESPGKGKTGTGGGGQGALTTASGTALTAAALLRVPTVGKSYASALAPRPKDIPKPSSLSSLPSSSATASPSASGPLVQPASDATANTNQTTAANASAADETAPSVCSSSSSSSSSSTVAAWDLDTERESSEAGAKTRGKRKEKKEEVEEEGKEEGRSKKWVKKGKEQPRDHKDPNHLPRNHGVAVASSAPAPASPLQASGAPQSLVLPEEEEKGDVLEDLEAEADGLQGKGALSTPELLDMVSPTPPPTPAGLRGAPHTHAFAGAKLGSMLLNPIVIHTSRPKLMNELFTSAKKVILPEEVGGARTKDKMVHFGAFGKSAVAASPVEAAAPSAAPAAAKSDETLATAVAEGARGSSASGKGRHARPQRQTLRRKKVEEKPVVEIPEKPQQEVQESQGEQQAFDPEEGAGGKETQDEQAGGHEKREDREEPKENSSRPEVEELVREHQEDVALEKPVLAVHDHEHTEQAPEQQEQEQQELPLQDQDQDQDQDQPRRFPQPTDLEAQPELEAEPEAPLELEQEVELEEGGEGGFVAGGLVQEVQEVQEAQEVQEVQEDGRHENGHHSTSTAGVSLPHAHKAAQEQVAATVSSGALQNGVGTSVQSPATAKVGSKPPLKSVQTQTSPEQKPLDSAGSEAAGTEGEAGVDADVHVDVADLASAPADLPDAADVHALRMGQTVQHTLPGVGVGAGMGVGVGVQTQSHSSQTATQSLQPHLLPHPHQHQHQHQQAPHHHLLPHPGTVGGHSHMGMGMGHAPGHGHMGMSAHLGQGGATHGHPLPHPLPLTGESNQQPHQHPHTHGHPQAFSTATLSGPAPPVQDQVPYPYMYGSGVGMSMGMGGMPGMMPPPHASHFAAYPRQGGSGYYYDGQVGPGVGPGASTGAGAASGSPYPTRGAVNGPVPSPARQPPRRTALGQPGPTQPQKASKSTTTDQPKKFLRSAVGVGGEPMMLQRPGTGVPVPMSGTVAGRSNPRFAEQYPYGGPVPQQYQQQQHQYQQQQQQQLYQQHSQQATGSYKQFKQAGGAGQAEFHSHSHAHAHPSYAASGAPQHQQAPPSGHYRQEYKPEYKQEYKPEYKQGPGPSGPSYKSRGPSGTQSLQSLQNLPQPHFTQPQQGQSQPYSSQQYYGGYGHPAGPGGATGYYTQHQHGPPGQSYGGPRGGSQYAGYAPQPAGAPPGPATQPLPMSMPYHPHHYYPQEQGPEYEEYDYEGAGEGQGTEEVGGYGYDWQGHGHAQDDGQPSDDEHSPRMAPQPMPLHSQEGPLRYMPHHQPQYLGTL